MKIFYLIEGDKVYVDSASIVGSIGAISFRLSLNSMIKEKRIERRRISSNE